MSRDPARFNKIAKYITDKEVSVTIAVLTAVSTSCVFLAIKYKWQYGLALIPGLAFYGCWIKGHIGLKMELEHQKNFQELMSTRHCAVIELIGRVRDGNLDKPLPITVALSAVFDALEEVCECDSKNWIGHDFFRKNFWRVLRAYWIHGNSIIIEQQKRNPKLWRHIFPTYKKYLAIFGEESEQEFYQFLSEERNESSLYAAGARY